MVRVEGVAKSYGKIVACRDIRFSAPDGTITAVVGPNGAGKSTLLSIIAGVLDADGGMVSFGDSSDRPPIGVLFEQNPLYPDMTVREELLFFAGIHGLVGNALSQAIERELVRCALTEEAGRRVARLSKGQRQRVGLAQALVHDPEILILDEPTDGLDPVQTAQFRTIIADFSPGKTIIVSSHDMSEIERICSRVVVMNRGTVAVEGSVGDVLARSGATSLDDAFRAIVGTDPGSGGVSP